MPNPLHHIAFLASVDPAVRATLTARTDRAGLLRLAGHFGAILFCAALIVMGVPGWWILVPIQGVLISFLFTLAHECTHKTPFATPWVNEVIGHLCGALLILPFVSFRYFHLAHHRWTNIEGKDPELDGPPILTRADWAWHVSGLPYWRAQIAQLLRQTSGNWQAPWLPERAKSLVCKEARILVVLYVAVIASLFITPMLFWVWLLPALIGQPVLRLYLLAEHGDCPQVENMFLNTRTIRTSPIVRWLAWNMPYHVEHHVWPQVPFHQLPALHHQTRDHLGVTSDGYIAFSCDYLARRTN